MTKCTGLWHKLDFGKSLDKECHGCTKRLMFKDPLDVEAQKPPLFSDHCPDREPIPTYHNYQPRFRA